MRKTVYIALTLAAALTLGSFPALGEEQETGESPAYTIGDSGISIPSAENEAGILKELGLFQGTGNGYALQKPVTRAEAITMTLRMIGEEQAAAESVRYHNFTDVSPFHWASGNIGYAANKGYISGTGETTFDPERTVTGKEFVKMLLTAMGYPEIYTDSAYEAGVRFSLLVNSHTRLAVETEGYPLLRNDVVHLCYAALLAKTADEKTLKDLLIEKGIFSQAHFNSLILAGSSGEVEGFAWDLNEMMPADKNYMFSPLSIKMALAMAAAGAGGTTKDEILKTLEIEDPDAFNQTAQTLMKEYAGRDKVELKIANSLWLNTDYAPGADFSPAFSDTVQKHYQADSERVNNENAIKRVNTWVNDRTNGKITELITTNEFLAYLVNAIYFKGEWAKPFNERATKKAEFTGRDGKKTELDFMNQTGYFDYYSDDSVQMVRLPYRDGKTSMYVALTAKRTAALDKNIEKMRPARVSLSLPRFKTEFGTKLIDTLSSLGIRTAFDRDRADFKGMFANASGNIFISDVIHKTFIHVDESGTEAAAVTGIEISATSAPIDPPVVFTADRPFTYLIRDDENSVILFMGEYAYGD